MWKKSMKSCICFNLEMIWEERFFVFRTFYSSWSTSLETELEVRLEAVEYLEPPGLNAKENVQFRLAQLSFKTAIICSRAAALSGPASWPLHLFSRCEKQNEIWRLSNIVPLNNSIDTARRVRPALAEVKSGRGGMLAADESRSAGWDV